MSGPGPAARPGNAAEAFARHVEPEVPVLYRVHRNRLRVRRPELVIDTQREAGLLDGNGPSAEDGVMDRGFDAAVAAAWTPCPPRSGSSCSWSTSTA